jgi:hypothetical protein
MKISSFNTMARTRIETLRFWVAKTYRSARDWVIRSMMLQLHPPRTLA